MIFMRFLGKLVFSFSWIQSGNFLQAVMAKIMQFLGVNEKLNTFQTHYTTMLVAAMNPCPCGYYGDPTHSCSCSEYAVSRYQKRISGPLLDRIDIQINVPRVEYEKLSGDTVGEPSASIQKRVEAARERQRERFAGNSRVTCNSEMSPSEIRLYCKPDAEGEKLLRNVMTHYQISARVYHRLLKLSRTIADLDGSADIRSQHIAEAIQYRPKVA